jgi:hypothetical protein
MDAQPNAAQPSVLAAIERVAPDLSRRQFLAEQLETGPSLILPAGRRPLVARLLAELRVHGVLVPAAVCADCDGPAEPLFIHRQVVRCTSCATHCPGCGHDRSHRRKSVAAGASPGHPHQLATSVAALPASDSLTMAATASADSKPSTTATPAGRPASSLPTPTGGYATAALWASTWTIVSDRPTSCPPTCPRLLQSPRPTTRPSCDVGCGQPPALNSSPAWPPVRSL